MDANKKGSERCPLIRKGKHRVLAFVFFLIYFAVLFYFLFFSEEMGRTYSERAYHYNLIPFHEIIRFVKYRHVLGWQAVVLNIWGNIIAFMPFGSFLPIYSKRCRNVWKRSVKWKLLCAFLLFHGVDRAVSERICCGS